MPGRSIACSGGQGCPGHQVCRDDGAAFDAIAPTSWPDPLARATITLALFLAYEFGYWLDHYLKHRVPALWELREHYPQAELHALSSPLGAEVIRLAPCVDRVWPLELAPDKRTWREQWRLVRALRRERFDLAFNFGANDRVSTFSKGMQQRLGLGAALLGEPELVFLDEPTSALDPVGRHDVREIIRGLASRGTAVFLNSHLLSEVEQVCDRVAVVDHGRVIASGTMDELLGGTAVRVRATGLTQADKNRLSGYGRIDDEGEQMTFANLDPDRVPELVASIVSMGGRVHEVAPRHQTLEDRFLQLLEDEERS